MSASRPAVFVDLDDTLVRSAGTKRIPMTSMLELVRSLHERGAVLFLWSRGGSGYARTVAEELKVADCFQAFLPKPQILLDDAEVGQWGMTKLHPSQCQGMSADEVLGLAS
ncbi:MAG: HAD family hydrolase [Myxococcales bacterium]